MSERALTRKGLLAGGVAGAAALAAASPAGASSSRRRRARGAGRVAEDDPALGSFEELISFHPGGIVSDAHRSTSPPRPFGPAAGLSGHGAWRSAGRGACTAFFRFLLQQAPPSAGAAVGTDNVRLLNLRHQQPLQRALRVPIRDTTGAAVFPAGYGRDQRRAHTGLMWLVRIALPAAIFVTSVVSSSSAATRRCGAGMVIVGVSASSCSAT